MTAPLPSIQGAVIMRGTYYRPDMLRVALVWARAKLASESLSAWERRYLAAEIERMALALATGRAA